MEIKDILSQRRKELNMTMKQVADKVGVSEGTISRWESGKIADMRRDKIMAYAQALNISPAIIMGWDNVDSSSTSESIHAGKRIPVLGSVAAGIPIDAIEDVLDWEDISEDMAKTGEFFGLRIKGDSMQPRIVEGDVVIVRQQPDADSGDVVIVQVNGDKATCKRLAKYSSGISLISFNPAYEPMNYTNEQIEQLPVTIIGKVVENQTVSPEEAKETAGKKEYMRL